MALRKIKGILRYTCLIPAFSCVVSALFMMVCCGVLTARSIFNYLHEFLSGHLDIHYLEKLVIDFVQIADFFLISTVILLIGVGIYELFVGSLGMPKWLEVSSIDELKNKLISIVITALSVQFLTKGVSSTTGELISFGGGVSMVIASLALYLYLSKQKAGAKVKEVNEYYELEKTKN